MKRTVTLVSGLCLALATSGTSVSAQSAPIELSPAAFRILCERFPLNSRCPGNTSTATSQATPTQPATTSPSSEAPSAEAPTAQTPADNTITEVAAASNSFQTLTAALEAAGLSETLSNGGPFTVFAPTDAAFAALPAGTVEALLKPENKAQLVKILQYHVVPAAAPSSSLQSGEVATVEGSPVEVTVMDGAVMVNDAKVVQADVPASNGIIHVIDKVMLPPGL